MRSSSRSLLVVLAGLALLMCSGCARMRSISNPDYSYGGYWGGADRYRGELSEFSLLGIDPTRAIAESEILNALDNAKEFRVKRGSAVLLLQSGAQFPDEPMAAALSKHFTVGPFSGVPSGKPDEAQPPNLSNALRLAAAQGGYDYILAYWGVLESQQQNLGTKAVSWVPIVGYAVPDETQNMRIRLKMILLDVRTGEWAMLVPEPVAADTISARANREEADQAQVGDLKEKGYAALVEELVKKHVE